MFYNNKIHELLDNELKKIKEYTRFLLKDPVVDNQFIAISNFRINFLRDLLQSNVTKDNLLDIITKHSNDKLEYLMLCDHYKIKPSEIVICEYDFVIESLTNIK